MGCLGLGFGILAMIGFGIAFIPLLGWLNGFNISLGAVASICSGVALSSRDPESRRAAIAGLIMGLVAVVVGALRLAVGGGIL